MKLFNTISTNKPCQGLFRRTRRMNKWHVLIPLAFAGMLLYWFSLPDELFPDPTSTVIEGRDGTLLGARIADDGQWRFPAPDSIPCRFAKVLLTFEDRYFYVHPGVNPLAIARALLQNIRAGHTVSGGSTLSMQVIRLSRKGRPRTLSEKVKEMVLATRLELRHPKKEILQLYAANAPYGGNVVGLDAAAWRYFGRPPYELSWAEAATLAVLPNAPSLIYPGKNKQLLLEKRNRLLDELAKRGTIDSLTCTLARSEPLPDKPYPLPMHTTHLLGRAGQSYQGQRIRTTIDPYLQEKAAHIVNTHYQTLKSNQVHNAAALVANVKTGEVLAYIGNTFDLHNPYHGQQVDVIMARRSTGSILKPFLFAMMMDEGTFLPNTLVPDIPTQIAGYSPKNYFLTWDGAVPARQSLSRSLNVPSVRMLQNFGVEKLHHGLQEMGMTTLRYHPGHYGLSLILGGAEGTLWDITGMYASLSRVLRNHYDNDRLYDPGDIRSLHFLKNRQLPEARQHTESSIRQKEGKISAAAVWLTWEALVEVNRPDADAAWRSFSSQGKVAWKTGTSFGGRDAWAVGTTRDYVVGVWAGNATGEGRPELTGIASAAPIMFHLFDLLPTGPWFEQPFREMRKIATCRHSGHRAGMYCTDIDSIYVHRSGLNTTPCPYHIRVHLNSERNYQVSSWCAEINEMVAESWFVLPPVMEYYYRRRNPAYRPLPPYAPDCIASNNIPVMEMIYPRDNTSIFIPHLIDGTTSETVFEVAHRNEHTTIFWHLNDTYAGQTRHIHQMGLTPGEGAHTLTLVDEHGEVLVQPFDVKSAR